MICFHDQLVLFLTQRPSSPQSSKSQQRYDRFRLGAMREREAAVLGVYKQREKVIYARHGNLHRAGYGEGTGSLAPSYDKQYVDKLLRQIESRDKHRKQALEEMKEVCTVDWGLC